MDGGDLSTSNAETADDEWPTASEESMRKLWTPSERSAVTSSISNVALDDPMSMAAAPTLAGSPPSSVYVHPAGLSSSITTGILTELDPTNFGTESLIT